MEKNWCNFEENEDSILQMGMEAYCSQKNIPIIYGDFFFTEALLKIKNPNFLAW
jgi:unsaturated chondroitin disaccharide hydrolase